MLVLVPLVPFARILEMEGSSEGSELWIPFHAATKRVNLSRETETTESMYGGTVKRFHHGEPAFESIFFLLLRSWTISFHTRRKMADCPCFAGAPSIADIRSQSNIQLQCGHQVAFSQETIPRIKKGVDDRTVGHFCARRVLMRVFSSAAKLTACP